MTLTAEVSPKTKRRKATQDSVDALRLAITRMGKADYRQAVQAAGLLYGCARWPFIQLQQDGEIVPIEFRRDDMTGKKRLVFAIATSESTAVSELFRATPEYQLFSEKHRRRMKCPNCGEEIGYRDFIAGTAE